MNLLKADGTAINTTKQFCELGMDLIIQAVQPIIDTSDELIVKLILNFGVTAYEKRIPRHEATDEQIKAQWSELLGQAFANHEIGRTNRGIIAGVANGQPKIEKKKGVSRKKSAL